jgi:hypothetical protein
VLGVPEHDGIDPELAALVASVDAAGANDDLTMALPLTLLVGGTVLSGFLVSSREWWAELATQLRQSLLREPDPHAMGRAAQFRDQLAASFEAAGTRTDEPTNGPKHVHLRMARTFEAGGVVPAVPEQTLLLRVRIDQVQGWSFGSLERTGPPSAISTLLDSEG